MPSDRGGDPTESVPTEALRRRWLLIVVFGLIGLSIGVGVSLVRAPVYTAKGELRVGQGDLQSQSLPSYAQGSQNLATAYSRYAMSQQLLQGVARTVGISLNDALSRVSAAPIPGSPTFRIDGQGDSEDSAKRLTDATLTATLAYVRAQTGGSSLAAQEAFSRFTRYSRISAVRELRTERLSRLRESGSDRVSADDVSRARALQAQSELLRDAYGSRYQSLVSTSLGSYKGASVLYRPLDAYSDQSSVLKQLAIVGLLAGLVLGTLLAITLTARRRPAPIV